MGEYHARKLILRFAQDDVWKLSAGPISLLFAICNAEISGQQGYFPNNCARCVCRLTQACLISAITKILISSYGACALRVVALCFMLTPLSAPLR